MITDPGGFGLGVGVLLAGLPLKAVRRRERDFILGCGRRWGHGVSTVVMVTPEGKLVRGLMGREAGRTHRSAGTPSPRPAPCSAGPWSAAPGTAAA